MSRLIRIFTVCLVNLFFILIFEIQIKQGRCPNLAVRPNIPDFTLSILGSYNAIISKLNCIYIIDECHFQSVDHDGVTYFLR